MSISLGLKARTPAGESQTSKSRTLIISYWLQYIFEGYQISLSDIKGNGRECS